ncbi:hypothetical protein E4656_13625 [Natronospirillum operosum]|uniref:Uncharacterized protein n=1 Tax=Natronospirillum operosum TaxID=2759953 RepID=A0A4Z0WA98_9GAMM|nr:hypothetical protein [Natronospirillum operosum]TGG92506.1 hypothetical protein E4656_13625 [Natronospirillum operosum]
MRKLPLGRKAAHLTADKKRPQGRQVMWEAIRAIRTFTIQDLEIKTNITQGTLRTYVMGLQRAGYLDRQEPERKNNRYGPVRWTLINDVGVEAPRVTRDGRHVTQGRGREQLWRTMRIIGQFTFHELAVQASTEELVVAPGEANFYCQYLHRAGYLVCMEKGGPNKAARYRLLKTRYTGPQAPQIQRVRQVWDPNTEQVVWTPEGQTDE